MAQQHQTNTASRLFPTYKRWDLTFKEAKGSYITDSNGKTYIDLMAGIGVVNLGHSHPAVTAAVEKQLYSGWHASNFFQYPSQEKTAALLTENSCGDLVFFANSGAEANEAAIKLVRKHTGRKKIISFVQSFHGRTLGSMAATGQESIQQGFGPMLEEFVYVPYNDVSALEKAIDEETAAVILEPLQGEGGVIPGHEEFLQKAEQLAEQYGALLVADEVQTGLGRTGAFFAHEHAGIKPDIITTAKALGNGFPTGAMIGKAKLEASFGPGSHGSTFGGNPLAMAAAEAVLTVLLEENLSKKTAETGKAFLGVLQKSLQPLEQVTEVRGRGLMIGIETKCPAAEKVLELQSKGVLVIAAGPSVIRLLPPLTTEWDTLMDGAKAIQEVLQ
ncbi:acetylornithine transaminase [Alteribacillus sp. HJP-4]|uniref:acetylornithine transaminase n=1 Tax=Alteribacillus sp. HJP-4 TaxID=2775394 RepID=UPI0035CD1CD9